MGMTKRVDMSRQSIKPKPPHFLFFFLNIYIFYFRLVFDTIEKYVART